MIDRYSRAEMARIWSQEAKYANWLRVELAVCEVYARRGLIPGDALNRIKARAKVDPRRIDEIEQTTRHDVIAFLTNLEESIGTDSRYVHIGMTSSDVLDTALALSLQEASDLLLAGLERLRAALRALAIAHKRTLCVGRSHGIHAEPMTFGLKAALWYAEAGRNLERLRRARETVRVGKISGAVGTFAHIDPDVEEEACHLLGLEPAPVSSQIVQRDRHAEFMATLAIVAASLEKIAVEVRSLQRTEIGEVEEPFAEGQKGSSAMPHKRNPVGSENITGLARLVRANAGAAFENVALWHERDITHSSVERVILPDSTILVDYMLHRFSGILEGLRVYPERMRENIERSFGLMYSQRVLLRLTGAGLARQAAYEIVQRNAMRAWTDRRSFQALLAADPAVTAHLGADALAECFDPAWYLRNVHAIYRRLNLS
ncbi:MAG TPA: adenylosuccinate lyase [Verrucomicrobiae bacterium]|jgi:adenylosuccinate lyase|nr:adenylosuccinate lyase [Verrucomicrobiae bacterium]